MKKEDILEALQDHLSFDVREECEAMCFWWTNRWGATTIGFAGDLEEEIRENYGSQ